MEEIKIIYQDEHFTACEKPPLTLSQQDAKGTLGLDGILSEQTNTPHKVMHRLDFGVGGTMVYAKSEKGASCIAKSIADRTFEKESLAVVYGKPAEEKGIYKDLLFKDSSKNKTFVVDRPRKGVKDASLEYRVIDSKETEKGLMSLVHIKLHTGRTHQIRVQFAFRKTPVYGDGKYGSKTNEKRVALWSHTVKLPHPVTKKPMIFSSLPDDSFPWNAFDFKEIT